MRLSDRTHLPPALRARSILRYIAVATAASLWWSTSSLRAANPSAAQSASKSRIVFDTAPAPTPESQSAAEASPSPAPSPTLASEPSPTPVAATPTPTPEATPAPRFFPPAVPDQPPAPIPTPESAPALPPAPTPVPTPESTPVAQAAATPTPEPVAAATPEPAPVAAASPEPTPAAVAASVAPAAPEGPMPSQESVASAAPLDGGPALGAGPAEPPAPSQSVTINLINKLVQRGILTREEANEMIRQAEAEAEVARQSTQADMFAVAQVAAAQAAADQIAVAEAANAPAGPNDVRVTYIPEPVKTQIKEEVKLELAADRATNQWATGVVIPPWVDRFNPFADLRLRYEGDFFPDGNDATGAFPNFNAINTGAPFDTTGTQFAPQLNVDQNRNRFRLRARIGFDYDLGENFTTGFRVATGDSNSPTSTNQSIGLPYQGQGGNFSKYAIWLDRAFLKYEIGAGTDKNITLLAGRFDNPFFSTPLIWDDDLGFDGVAARIKYDVLPGVIPFLYGGAFPVYNTDFNFSSNQPAKFASYDKFLFGIQGGVEWKPTPDWNLKVAAAYYYFQNIEGRLSSPYTPQSANDASDTDASRPSFAQKGNTYMAIRNIVPDASNDFGAINQWQYYGLATKFQELALTARLDYNGFEPVQVSLIGEFVQNLAFNSSDINAIAVNNRGTISDPTELDAIGNFEGDPYAWLVELRVGKPALAKRWDWTLSFGYRWIGSDAVVDGFNDSDFGLGGTNMKGFTAAGSVALSKNVWLALRWMGADSIAGPTYKSNIIQLDLNSRF